MGMCCGEDASLLMTDITSGDDALITGTLESGIASRVAWQLHLVQPAEGKDYIMMTKRQIQSTVQFAVQPCDFGSTV